MGVGVGVDVTVGVAVGPGVGADGAVLPPSTVDVGEGARVGELVGADVGSAVAPGRAASVGVAPTVGSAVGEGSTSLCGSPPRSIRATTITTTAAIASATASMPRRFFLNGLPVCR